MKKIVFGALVGLGMNGCGIVEDVAKEEAKEQAKKDKEQADDELAKKDSSSESQSWLGPIKPPKVDFDASCSDEYGNWGAIRVSDGKCFAQCDEEGEFCLEWGEVPSQLDPSKKVKACDFLTGEFQINDVCEKIEFYVDEDEFSVRGISSKTPVISGSYVEGDEVQFNFIAYFENAGYLMQYKESKYPRPTYMDGGEYFPNMDNNSWEFGRWDHWHYELKKTPDVALNIYGVNISGFPKSKSELDRLVEQAYTNAGIHLKKDKPFKPPQAEEELTFKLKHEDGSTTWEKPFYSMEVDYWLQDNIYLSFKCVQETLEECYLFGWRM